MISKVQLVKGISLKMSSMQKIRRTIINRAPRLAKFLRRLKRVFVGQGVHYQASDLQADDQDPAALAVSGDKNVIPKFYPSARAKRPIGIFYDELSRGINPFSQIETCGVADVTDPVEHIADLFDKFNIVKVRRVYSPERSKLLNQHCIDFSGLQPGDFRDVFTKKKKWATGGAPVLHDDRFWPYVSDPKIAEIVQRVLGPDSFEFGSAVAAHYSARGLHRDYRPLVEGDDSPYSIKNPQKRIMRILHYCGVSGGALGYIPFSHNEIQFAEKSKLVDMNRPTEWFNRHRDVLTQARLKRNFVQADEIERHISWLNADPGDIILSNSAMLHCGEYLIGPRYLFVSTYAENNAETLVRAVAQSRTPKAQAYHKFMASHGFKGSLAVLEESKKPAKAKSAPIAD
jgi:hypothetical protein